MRYVLAFLPSLLIVSCASAPRPWLVPWSVTVDKTHSPVTITRALTDQELDSWAAQYAAALAQQDQEAAAVRAREADHARAVKEARDQLEALKLSMTTTGAMSPLAVTAVPAAKPTPPEAGRGAVKKSTHRAGGAR